MALEIPVLASPVGVNNSIIEHGKDGFLCQNLEDWKNYLTQLIENPDLRKEIGIQGRKKIIDEYSVQSNSQNFLDLFN